MGSPSTWNPKPTSWEIPKTYPDVRDIWSSDGPSGSISSGVIVDPIKTYHMGVALATKQTPFALLKPDNGTPVLVKVVDTKLPNGKQMLVPATAEDLRVGGKMVLQNNDEPPIQDSTAASLDMPSAMQIRVPVVATVIPKIRAGGRLHLTVEEPHHAYHTALSTDVGEATVEPCTIKVESHSPPKPAPGEETHRQINTAIMYDEQPLRPGGRISSTCALPPPAPSPPLDLISLDLFEPMACIPMGPQITAVENIDQPPPSDDSDIFIGEFEKTIPLSDSD